MSRSSSFLVHGCGVLGMAAVCCPDFPRRVDSSRLPGRGAIPAVAHLEKMINPTVILDF
jgi:hypothetical protein